MCGTWARPQVQSGGMKSKVYPENYSGLFLEEEKRLCAFFTVFPSAALKERKVTGEVL